MQVEEKWFMKLYIWLLTGLLLATGAGLLKVGGGLDVQNLMNQERIYDVSKEELTMSSKTIWYDAGCGVFSAQKAKSTKLFRRLPYTRAWNYLNISISNLNTETAVWWVIYYDNQGGRLGKQEITVTNGENLIPITQTEPFRRFRITIRKQRGQTFSIDALQLRMNTVEFSGELFEEGFAGALGAYLFLSFLLSVFFRVRGRDALEVLQFAYTLPGDYLGSRITRRLSERAVRYLRTFLFLLLFLIAPVMNICGVYYKAAFYKYGILACALLLFLIALLSWERPLEQIKWSNALQTTWFILWGWICLSDLIVSKYFKYIGYVFLFVVGFFFFVWNNMDRPKRMVNNLVRGLEWTFPIFLVYTLICRRRYVGILYNGAFANREDMSLYALALLIAFLAELHFVLLNKTVCHRKKRIILHGVCVALAVYFLYRAYTLTCIFAGVVVILVFLVRLIREYRMLPLGIGGTVGMLALSLVCACVAVFGVNRFNMYRPDWLGTDIVYQHEQWETDLSFEEMAQIEATAPGYFANVKHTTEQDREMIWTNYLSRMNFFGHEGVRIYVSRNLEFSGNALLEMAYRYGIFVLIPYSLLLLLCLYTSWKRKGFLMPAVTFSFGGVMLTQNMEQPFLQPLWILFYLGMGIWFDEREE